MLLECCLHSCINWTLRNWNMIRDSWLPKSTPVLIGPCGIETKVVYRLSKFIEVLIGPCGIETCFCRRSGYCTGVLIGPCGIKTCDFVFLIDCYSDTNEKDFNWLECFIFDIILYMKVTSIIYWFLKCSFIE